MDVQTAAQNVAEDYKGAGGSGAKALAADIDKNGTTFAHQLSETGGAVLGLRTAVKMTLRSKDLRILNAFASEAGCMVFPLPETLKVEGNGTMQDLGDTVREFGEVIQEISADSVDGEFSANEVQRIERAWGEHIAAGQRMIANIRAKHDAGKAKLQRVA
ncbi:phage regulatory CII family protein [uncultured Ramlibacter sp.]|uniref:phage regulatory CII family protein n=1 Tax=uncultured Ramlibacter sp. TaxID=260755 RepID=UPI0026140E5A|nr:phage regulatory CII family protein [uncultured Ramlibacter sp.]